MDRLARIGVPTLVVAQYGSQLWLRDNAAYTARQLEQTRLALECARKTGLATLDTHDVVADAVRREGAATLYGPGGHHTAAGNHLIAESVAQELERRGMLGR
jgi:hypothetical protein